MSTTGVYGDTGEAKLTEHSRCVPTNDFEIIKHEGEVNLLELSKRTSMEIVILRVSNVIGEAQPSRRLLSLMQAIQKRKVILTQPPGWQNIVYVDDVAEAALRLGLSAAPGTTPEIYNVNSPISNDALVAELSRLLGVSAKFPVVPMSIMSAIHRLTTGLARIMPGRFSGVNSKIEQLIDPRIYDSGRLCSKLRDWPRIGLEAALPRLVKYYQRHGWI